jgi:hypothetical protein
MTTAESLERLNEAEFELLAVRSLRELEADCQAVIHFGMNAQGKTIPGPLDGFCRVPGINPPRFVMIAATTTNLTNLKAKWLAPLSNEDDRPKRSKGKSVQSRTKVAASPDDGDVTKAIKQAAILRKENPSGSFILHLATNRNLPLELESVTRNAGDAEGLEVRFLEQSRLRDFLDMKPVGQWLRQEHLGIEADQVSVPLIRQLCQKNVVSYSNDVAMFDDFAPTETKSSILALSRLKDPSAYLHLLVGSSGVGKSVTASCILRSHIASGGIGIWLPSETIENNLSLSEAIRAVLSALHPKLGRDAGASTMALAAEHGPIVLVVDDINRSQAPLRVMMKLLGWLRPDSSKTTGIRLAGRLHVLCPLWESYWSSISSDAEKNDWIDVQHLTRFKRAETTALFKTAPRLFSDSELDQYADALEDDPILVGLFVRMLRVHRQADPTELCHDAIGNFIRTSTNDLAMSRGHSPESYIAAIQELARQMVLRRSFHPTWSEVEGWLAQNTFTLQRVDGLAGQGHICRIRERDRDRIIEFRHDRLLEFCISNALEAILRGAATLWTPAFDPYYTPYLGRCLARTDFDNKVLDRVLQESPAALVTALRSLPASSSGYARQLVNRVAAWLSQCRRSSAVMRHAVQLLREAETPFTIEVTNPLKNDLSLWDGRLRCGDAYAGALSLSHDFLPGSNSAWFEQLVEEAYAHHRNQLVNGVVGILHSERNTAILKGSLTLAGYLNDPDLSAAISTLWGRVSENGKKTLLLQALWAALRCTSDGESAALAPILESILLLDDSAEDPSRLSERARLLSSISFAGRHGYSVPVQKYLVEIGCEERFETTVIAILERVDHPIAIRFVATKLAWWSEQAHRAKSFSHYANTWRENWENKHGGSPISAESLAELRFLWEDTQQPEWLRSYAFACWTELTPDIESLKDESAPCPSDSSSVWQRAKAGDRGATKDFLAYLKQDWHWLYVMPEIWSSELIRVASDWLAKIQDLSTCVGSDLEHALARVIRDIPTEDGEALLLQNWGILGCRQQFVQAALHVSSERTRELAQQSIDDWRGEDDPFEHIDRYFFTGFYKVRPDDRLSLRQMEGLAPYVNRLSSQMLGEMLDFCGKRGYFDFARISLLPEGRRRLARAQSPDQEGGWLYRSLREWFPTQQELTEELTRFAGADQFQQGFQVERMVERFLKTDQPLEVLFETLEAWLTELPDKDRFTVSATVVRNWGKRSSVSILENCSFAKSAAGQELLADSRYDVFRRSLD